MEEEEALRGLWEEVREVREVSLGTPPAVERLHCPPCPLDFLRDFVSSNKPCIISNAISHWPALSHHRWTNAYLSNALRHSTVSLHLTPNGRADALAPVSSSSSDLCFASSHVERMLFPDALSHIIASSSGGGLVAYAQEQNNCFISEYSPLVADVETHIPWATEALGCLPEAVNLWIGNHLSHTSFHKDHYENLYAVLSGEKHFLLLPPTDVHRMYIRDYPSARYHYSKESGEFMLKLDEPLRCVPWCSVDPYPRTDCLREEQISLYPRYYNGPEPFTCTVKAGEVLYLPSMWFHHVRQTPDSEGRTIAINYCERCLLCFFSSSLDFRDEIHGLRLVSEDLSFLTGYDMQFDIKYAYFNFLQSIG